MDCRIRNRTDLLRGTAAAPLRVIVGVVLLVLSASAAAVGTDAGRRIDNVAQAMFDIGGVAQPGVSSNTVSVTVDEVLDVVVIDAAAAPVQVTSGASAAPLWFTVANTGNGSEAFRLVFDTAVLGDDFDPSGSSIYLESNGTPGLQVGAGGDTSYVAGTNDPTLARDTSLSVYVASNIPGGLAAGALGRVAVRAVARSVYVASGTDDPANPAFPAPGTAYPGAGDAALGGGGNVTAVVGISYAQATLLLRAEGTYRVNAALVALNKTVAAITDPFGGNTLVPGSVIRYAITVTVAGAGAVENLVIRDPIPGAMVYVPGSLVVSALPAGQQADDDFAPIGSDNTGFDGPNNTVVVSQGDAVGGGAPVVISFNTTIR